MDLVEKRSEKALTEKRRGVSPVVATIILVSVAITITVAVAYGINTIFSKQKEDYQQKTGEEYHLKVGQNITLDNITIYCLENKKLEFVANDTEVTLEISDLTGEMTIAVNELKLKIISYSNKEVVFKRITNP